MIVCVRVLISKLIHIVTTFNTWFCSNSTSLVIHYWLLLNGANQFKMPTLFFLKLFSFSTLLSIVGIVRFEINQENARLFFNPLITNMTKVSFVHDVRALKMIRKMCLFILMLPVHAVILVETLFTDFTDYITLCFRSLHLRT